MNQHQRACMRVDRGFATLTELSREPGYPMPELTLMMPAYIDPSSKAFVPASSITIHASGIQALHDLINGYYAQAKKA